MAGFLMNVGKAGDVAERSPAVISANLKEDMLLEKKMVILNRSERSVVHQIKVDQKVLYKRFQSRLVRSKLAFSRIMGQKDVEKNLRSKNIGRLNSDIVGQSDEEYSFLEKLELRPCTASSYSPRISMPPRKNEGKEGGSSKSKGGERVRSARARLEDKGAKDSDREECERHVRPATTLGLRLNAGMLLQNRTPKRGRMSPIAERAELMTDTSKQLDQMETVNEGSSVKEESDGGENEASLVSDDQQDSARSSQKKSDEEKEDCDVQTPSVAFLEQLEFADTRPKSMGDMKYFEESPPISPKQLSRRASKAADFFQEEKKIDHLALRLKEAKSKDYTERVQEFCDEMETMINAPDRPTVDYYASRLQASMVESLSKPLTNVPGTPEEENKRAMGNIHIRSLTVPVLNLDY